MYKLIRDSN